MSSAQFDYTIFFRGGQVETTNQIINPLSTTINHHIAIIIGHYVAIKRKHVTSKPKAYYSYGQVRVAGDEFLPKGGILITFHD